MNSQMVEALRAMDSFLKNCQLLFDDFVATIKDRTLKSPSVEVFLERSYQVWNPSSWGMCRWIWNHDGRFSFGNMLIKIDETWLRASDSFKEICSELNVDPVFPMILVAGVLEPKDPARLRTGEAWYKRAAVDDAVLLGRSDSAPAKHVKRTEYKTGSVVSITYDNSVDWRRCQEARFRIWPLEDIPDSKVLGQVVDEVLRL